jgi:hypothetical protein
MIDVEDLAQAMFGITYAGWVNELEQYCSNRVPYYHIEEQMRQDKGVYCQVVGFIANKRRYKKYTVQQFMAAIDYLLSI